MSKTREYKCKCDPSDILHVPHTLDDDGDLGVWISSSTTVYLRREQVENLWELLGNALGKNDPIPTTESLWEDVGQ